MHLDRAKVEAPDLFIMELCSQQENTLGEANNQRGTRLSAPR
jgi:hypothetical protein